MLESLDRSLAEGRHEHAGRAYIHLVDVAQRNRRWDLMDRYFTAGLEYCEDHGLDLWARYLCVYSARTELDRGRWAAAARAIPPTVERPGSVLPRIGALVVLGLLRARRGDPGQRVGRTHLEGSPARRDRHRQRLRGVDPSAR